MMSVSSSWRWDRLALVAVATRGTQMEIHISYKCIYIYIYII